MGVGLLDQGIRSRKRARGSLTRSITHSGVEGGADDANIKWLVGRRQAFDMFEVRES